MKNLSNIEKSGFRKGEYVGYSDEGVQRIRRGGAGWETYGLASALGSYIRLTAPTLEELNNLLIATRKAFRH
jgi:hypothetical protein